MPPRPSPDTTTATDREAWLTVAARVRPLVGRERLGVPTAPAPPALRQRAKQPPVPPSRDLQPLAIGVQPPGLDRASWRRLAQGRVPPARRLDLHGMRATPALAALERFVAESFADGCRVVEVITGRGAGAEGGVIRRTLLHWLNGPSLRPMLLGACHPHAANPGAVLLLLRRHR